jgi:exosome complex RNA-binding protein Rrp4
MISPVKPLEMANEWLLLVVSCSQMNAAAAEVIARRARRILQGDMTLAEAVEIVAEKPSVMAIACKKAALATVRGGDPVKIAHAALMPFKEKTLSNLRKLRAQ